ncbi:hypothetical protein [Massilia phyllosphaerae]|uniref:hypothetical protein n=1 Tax=Massilia phyllosphaerae TaxID=3106034 RepID=UPI002B1CAC35|nr:hypothetical protein [Massilia sp. SGZ-792]
MKFAKPTIMRIAAALALTAAATSSFAQSQEARRGFDAGYEAGQRDAQYDRGGPRGPRWDRVRILEAEYGARGRMCDARRAVQRDVVRNRGAIQVDNGLCGDPAGGIPKRLRVVYRCHDTAPGRVVAREGETLRLTCRW